MSKKSERDAQVRKQRMAQPLERQAQAYDADLSERKSAKAGDGLFQRFRRLPKQRSIPVALLVLLVVFSCLSGIVSLIVPPSVPVPTSLVPSIVPPVEIVNSSPLPVYKLQYVCQFVSLTDQSGFSVGPSAPVPDEKATQSILYFKQKIPVECVGGTHLAGIRIRNVEFRVSLSYFHLGWPFRRHTEYRVESEFDPQGRFMHWTVQ
jgi:hypothetical protein